MGHSKGSLRGKFIATSAYIKRTERSQINGVIYFEMVTAVLCTLTSLSSVLFFIVRENVVCEALAVTFFDDISTIQGFVKASLTPTPKKGIVGQFQSKIQRHGG
jgi:hypothetical protein